MANFQVIFSGNEDELYRFVITWKMMTDLRKYEAKKREVEELEERVKKIREEIMRLEEQRRSLQREVMELTSRREALKKELEKLNLRASP